jgi:hypothetical protein
MGFELVAKDGRTVSIAADEWLPTVELLSREGLLEPLKVALAHYNACTAVTGDEARRIAAFLDGYLATVPAEGRILLDGSVTTGGEPPRRNGDGRTGAQGVTVRRLAHFRDFCRSSGGFLVE